MKSEWVPVPGGSVRKFGWFEDSYTTIHHLRAPTSIHHHPWYLAMNDLLFVVKVKHINGGHLGGGATRPCRTSWICVLHQVCVWVFLHEHVLALTRAVVGFVAFGGNDPVPSKRLKVHSQRVATAAGFGGVLVAVQAQVSPGAFAGLKNFHFQKRLLESGGRRRVREGGRRKGGGYKRTNTHN